MEPTPLHFVWEYTDVDRAFWAEHFEDWLPDRIFDAHTHIMDPKFRLIPVTEPMRRQYWVNELREPITAEKAARCHHLVFPKRNVNCIAFGVPGLDFDIDAGNDWLQQQCVAQGWFNLAVVRPQWNQEKVAALLDRPQVIGLKPYYSLLGFNPDTRDEFLEANIFDFLPHHVLEVANARHAWVTLHVPKADRLGHPENIREIRELRRLYPNVVLVIAHLGRCYTEPHALEAIPQLADDPGIYFDSSAVLNPESHRVALEHLGPGRVLYGSDNPIFYMRGRREFSNKSYINRTSHPFHFNQRREPPEVEAKYTLMMYEDLKAMKQACQELGINERGDINAIFHDNTARLVNGILARKKL